MEKEQHKGGLSDIESAESLQPVKAKKTCTCRKSVLLDRNEPVPVPLNDWSKEMLQVMKNRKPSNKEAAVGEDTTKKGKGKRSKPHETEDKTQGQARKTEELQDGQIMFTPTQDSDVIVIGEDKVTEEKSEVPIANEETPVVWNQTAANNSNMKITENKEKTLIQKVIDESLMITEASFAESIMQTTRQIK